MSNLTTSLKPFSVWAKETKDQHPEILKNWLNGTDPYKRAVARTILETVGVVQL